MRNLIIAGFVLGSATGVFLFKQTENVRRMERVRALETQRTESTARLAECSAAMIALREQIEAEKRRLGTLPYPLSTNTVAMPAADVSTEGSWPANKPYFYLRKQVLPMIRYVSFDTGERLTKEAAELFGMTSDEKQHVQASLQQMIERLRKEELKAAYPTNNPPQLSWKEGKKRSVYIPIPEGREQAREDFYAQLRNLLSTERANIFINGAKEQLDNNLHAFYEKPRTLTFVVPEQGNSEVVVSTDSGSMFFPIRELEDEPSWARTQYQHLIDAFQLGAE